MAVRWYVRDRETMRRIEPGHYCATLVARETEWPGDNAPTLCGNFVILPGPLEPAALVDCEECKAAMDKEGK
jgi:hypothetical protein